MTTETIIRNVPFNTLVEKASARVHELNPVDRTTKLEKMAFFRNEAPLPEGANRDNFDWILKPIVESGFDSPNIIIPDIQLSRHALRQLIEMVGYKMSLLETLPSNLIFQSVNHLMQNYAANKVGFIRTVHGDEARAILSGRFTPLDDLDLLEICADYLEGAVVRFHGWGELSTHLTVTFPDEVMDGGIEPGIHIANSEVGSRAISIQSVLFRRICTNVLPRIAGMKDGASLAYGNNGDLYERLNNNPHDFEGARSGTVQSGWRFVHHGDPNKLRTFVSDAIQEAKQTHTPMLDMWKEGLRQTIENPAKAIGDLSKKNKLTKDELQAVLNAHTEEASVSGMDFANTLTGIVNGFTRAANEAPNIEQRYKLQVAGASGFVYLQ